MAFSSKLLTLTLSSSLLRYCRPASPSVLSNPSRSLTGPLLSQRFCSAAAAAVDVPETAVSVVSSKHPWPEWDEFLDKLRAKGYFERPAPATGASTGEGAADGEVVAAAAENAVASVDTYPFKDLNRVKNACLKFARERYDLLNFLPKQDIQAIVQCGCPNIFRKPVNSAKRLRQVVQVEERDACGACKFRGSCDKAYRTITPEEEVEAKTVDVVRILLSYAVEPSSLSGENSVDGSVQESARKLLSELTARSDTTIDPSCIKPVSNTYSKSKESVAKAQGSVGKGRKAAETEMKRGDWLCPKCNFLNFARNHHCLECKADGPTKIEVAITEMKMGDWICTQCHFMNFSRNKICFKCEGPRPKRQLNPGEWECPSCCFLNFRRNKVCKKCDHDCPDDDTQYNHLGPRNIGGAERNRTFDYMEDNDDSVSRYKGLRKHGGRMEEERSPRRMSARNRSVGFSKSRRAEEEDDDVLPFDGVRRHAASRRATPAQKSFTAGRSQ
ncbi:hypothetical protein QOZ80_3AG0219350 [Eleusine coracana subsp. coracana]|nr:hypothetical protein QOZ80_3AG0219350 [Eleusine coracana subsp. coracana]